MRRWPRLPNEGRCGKGLHRTDQCRAAAQKNIDPAAHRGLHVWHLSLYSRFFVGGIAQLGERLHGMQEVSGSIPLTSTSTNKEMYRSKKGCAKYRTTGVVHCPHRLEA